MRLKSGLRRRWGSSDRRGSLKQAWVADLSNWVSTHQSQLSKGDISDWVKKHPNDVFLPNYIRASGKKDPDLSKWIADAAELLKRYPK
jgi:hypothetical protein